MDRNHERQQTVWDWLIPLIVVGGLVIALFSTGWAQDSQSHHLFHQFYEKWKTKEGNSCCNHMDCHPAQVRQKGETVEVFIEKEWIVAPPDTVRPYTTPDMQSHVCNQGKRIICVSVGGGI